MHGPCLAVFYLGENRAAGSAFAGEFVVGGYFETGGDGEVGGAGGGGGVGGCGLEALGEGEGGEEENGKKVEYLHFLLWPEMGVNRCGMNEKRLCLCVNRYKSVSPGSGCQ